MPKRIVLAASLLLAACAATGGASAADTPPPSDKLTAALKGRTAGKPQSCISLTPSPSSRIFDGAIIYEATSHRWYVNRPDGGKCVSLRPGRAIVTSTPTTQLCRGDLIRVIDPPGPMEYGSCGLDDFVPYTK